MIRCLNLITVPNKFNAGDDERRLGFRTFKIAIRVCIKP